MDDVKSIFASKTVWASLIGLLAMAFPKWGPVLATVDPAGFATQISSLITALAFIGAIIGRLVATKQVAISPQAS